jgi:N-carbamoylputrescine amidase
MKNYKIAVVQVNLNDVAEKNLKKCLEWTRKAATQGAEVICLPELYGSHYFCQSEDTENFALAEPLYSTSFTAFSALAKELGVVIIVPFFEKRLAGVYHNSAYIIDTDLLLEPNLVLFHDILHKKLLNIQDFLKYLQLLYLFLLVLPLF